MLEAIARVLQLDDDHFSHLLTSVAQAPIGRARRQRRQAPQAGMLKLPHSLVQSAFFDNRYFDVLAISRTGTVLASGLVVGGHSLRDLFPDPAAKAFSPEREDVTERFIATLRQAVGTDVDDPRFIDSNSTLTRETYLRNLVSSRSLPA